jgi:hypothetical protein
MHDHLVDVARKITLHQNSPDPFRTTTSIGFTLRESAVARLTIHDLHGMELTTLLNEWRPAGHHAVAFNGEGYPEGLYLYRLSVDNLVRTKTMLLLR